MVESGEGCLDESFWSNLQKNSFFKSILKDISENSKSIATDHELIEINLANIKVKDKILCKTRVKLVVFFIIYIIKIKCSIIIDENFDKDLAIIFLKIVYNFDAGEWPNKNINNNLKSKGLSHEPGFKESLKMSRCFISGVSN
jgi:hypothetical protein